ncbi:hypothetical protein NDU88_009264 [Pleurodeles waltl]|uniref:Ion transport domain-containing protein n=1 Tax=Pleurodeles waltl TaxID=8319 RepID=A0AAV7P0E5_PLEWA|nr:hypothetical protein NDU88_009264 [Pleurodeles waltl]
MGSQILRVACSVILNALSKKEKDPSNIKEMKDLADDFEKQASGVFSECYRNNHLHAESLLFQKSLAWGNKTCLQLVLDAYIMSFMLNGGVQAILTKIWWGKLSVDNTFIRVLICIVFFPLVCINFLQFRDPEVKHVAEGKITDMAADKRETKRGDIESAKDDSREVRQEVEVKRTDLAAENRGSNSYLPKVQQKDGSKKEQGTDGKKVRLTCLQCLHGFFTAPVVVFYYNAVSYIGFLWLFAYVLMIDFQAAPSWTEYLLYVWIFSLVCEEVRQFLCDHKDVGIVTKGKLYISEIWNQMDFVAIILFIAGIVCRLITHWAYVGRVFLALDFIVFCLRLMFIFTLSRTIGPKVVLLKRMVKDIIFFLFLLTIWIVSFGVSKQAIIVHNEQRFYWILQNVLYKPYRTLFGDILTDVDKTAFDETKCSVNGSDIGQPKCPQTQNGVPVFPEWLTICLLCLYLLIANILLLNLLIAMFSYTFSEVQEKNDQIWRFQRHKLVIEYSNRPPGPPPFIFFNLLYYLVRNVIQKWTISKKRENQLDNKTTDLLPWEEYMKGKYLFNQQEMKKQSSEMKIGDTSNKVDAVVTLLDIEQETHAKAMDKRLMLLEKQVSQSREALNWIMKSLKENGLASKEKAPIGKCVEWGSFELFVHVRQKVYPV